MNIQNLRKKGSINIFWMIILCVLVPWAPFIYLRENFFISQWWALLALALTLIFWRVLQDWWYDGKINGITQSKAANKAHRRWKKGQQ